VLERFSTMRLSRCTVVALVLGIAAILPGESRLFGARTDDDNKPADRTPDQRARDLIKKYEVLVPEAKAGPTGDKIIQQLRGLSKELPVELRETVARLEVQHNLRKIDIKIPNIKNTPGKVPAVDPYAPSPYFPQWRPKWEYKVASESEVAKLGKGDLAAGLNQLGEDGWDLVAVHSTAPASGALTPVRYVFKRLK
jgi:hypothetical protein